MTTNNEQQVGEKNATGCLSRGQKSAAKGRKPSSHIARDDAGHLICDFQLHPNCISMTRHQKAQAATSTVHRKGLSINLQNKLCWGKSSRHVWGCPGAPVMNYTIPIKMMVQRFASQWPFAPASPMVPALKSCWMPLCSCEWQGQIASYIRYGPTNTGHQNKRVISIPTASFDHGIVDLRPDHDEHHITS